MQRHERPYGRQARRIRALGHGGTGGVRSSATLVVSRDGRVAGVLRGRLPRQLEQHCGQGALGFLWHLEKEDELIAAPQWYPEVAHFCEGVPIILVATKIDLRKDATAVGLIRAQGHAPLSYAEGAGVAQRMGAKYMEVSALEGTGVQEVFDLALREAMGKRGGLGVLKRKVKCTIL